MSNARWTITQHALASAPARHRLTLPFELRQKARFATRLDGGQAVGVQLPRGKVLRGGDKLLADNDEIIEVVAAPETLSVVRLSDPTLLAKICYHLGNRHVPLQIEAGACCYAHDHVLDQMVLQLGGQVNCEQLPFEPESGAYSRGGHAHAH